MWQSDKDFPQIQNFRDTEYTLPTDTQPGRHNKPIFTYKYVYRSADTCTHAHMLPHPPFSVILRLYPFMSEWSALFVGSRSPAETDLDCANPAQSRGKGRRIFDNR